MKGSRRFCPKCKNKDGLRISAQPGGGFHVRCSLCDLCIEEWVLEPIDIPIDTQTDLTHCAITPDLLKDFEFEELPGDPFTVDPVSGFVTAFAQLGLERSLATAEVARSFSGDLAGLEELAAEELDLVLEEPDKQGLVVARFALYFDILSLCYSLDLSHDIASRGYRLCRGMDAGLIKNSPLVAAAVVWAQIRQNPARITLAHVCELGSVSQKDVLNFVVQHFAGVNGPSGGIVPGPAAHVALFCENLSLKEPIPSLATHIAVQSASVASRRQPASVCAAAIYLACRLEKVEKKQREIVEVAHSTEVTLRKVCKELVERLDALLPPGYTPVRPLSEIRSRSAKNKALETRPSVDPSLDPYAFSKSFVPYVPNPFLHSYRPVIFPNQNVNASPESSAALQKAALSGQLSMPAPAAPGGVHMINPFSSSRQQILLPGYRYPFETTVAAPDTHKPGEYLKKDGK